MIDAALRAYMHEEQTLSKWGNLYTKANKKSKIRNRLAHFETIYDMSNLPQERAYLVPCTGSPTEFLEAMQGTGTRWSYKDVSRFADDFMSLYAEIELFLSSLPLPTPPPKLP